MYTTSIDFYLFSLIFVFFIFYSHILMLITSQPQPPGNTRSLICKFSWLSCMFTSSFLVLKQDYCYILAPVKMAKNTIHYGPWDRNGLYSRFGDRTHSKGQARALTSKPLPVLEPKTYLWRYFAKPLRHRLPANRWRRYTPLAVILLILSYLKLRGLGNVSFAPSILYGTEVEETIQ